MEKATHETRGLVIRAFENAYFLCNGRPPKGCEGNGKLYIGEAVRWFDNWNEALAMRRMIDNAYGFEERETSQNREKKFYAAIEDSEANRKPWVFLYATNLTAAKREASRLFGKYTMRHHIVIGVFEGFTEPPRPIMELDVIARKAIKGTWEQLRKEN